MNNGINWNIPLEFRDEFEGICVTKKAHDIVNSCARTNENYSNENKYRSTTIFAQNTHKKREKWDSSDESKTWTFGRKSSSCEWTIT